MLANCVQYTVLYYPNMFAYQGIARKMCNLVKRDWCDVYLFGSFIFVCGVSDTVKCNIMFLFLRNDTNANWLECDFLFKQIWGNP